MSSNEEVALLPQGSEDTEQGSDMNLQGTPESSACEWSIPSAIEGQSATEGQSVQTPEGQSDTEGPISQPEPVLALLAGLGLAAQMDESIPKEDLNSQSSESSTFKKKAEDYYVQAKDRVIEVIATVGDKLVLIRAKVCEVSLATKGSALAYADQAKLKFQAKTIWIQDGYVYMRATIDGKVAIVKAKTSEVFDFAKGKAIQGRDIIDEYTASVKARAITIKDSVTSATESVTSRANAAKSKSVALVVASKERAIVAVQPIKPYYMKVHNGVVHIVTNIGDKVVVVQAKTADIFRSIQVRVVESSAPARAAIQRFSSPYVSRVMSFGDVCTNKIQHFNVSIKNGVLSITGAIDARIVYIRTQVSEVLDVVRARTTNGIDSSKEAISALAAKISGLVSSVYGQACSNAKLIYAKTNDGLVYIACQVNDRTLVLKVKLSEVIEYLRSLPLGLYDKSRAAMIDGYSLARVKASAATKFTRAKSLEVTANVRSLAGKQSTHVTAASAAGGAVALGAGGGAAGLLAGGGVGVLLAPFTFGLSIPVGATAGLVIGGTAGGTAGFVAGGAAGNLAHKHKDEIGDGVNSMKSKVKGYKGLAHASTVKLCTKVMGSTGGSATA